MLGWMMMICWEKMVKRRIIVGREEASLAIVENGEEAGFDGKWCTLKGTVETFKNEMNTMIVGGGLRNKVITYKESCKIYDMIAVNWKRSDRNITEDDNTGKMIEDVVMNNNNKQKEGMGVIHPFHVAVGKTTNESDVASNGERQHETMEQQQGTVGSQKAGKIPPRERERVGAGIWDGGGDCVGIAAEPDDGRCKGKQRERGRRGSRTWIVPAHHEKVCVPEVDLIPSGNASRVVDRTSIAAYCKLLRETIGEFTLDRELGGDASCPTSTEYYLLGFANVCAIEAAD